MKHTLMLALALALGTAAAGTLPNSQAYNAPVSLSTPISGLSLEAALSSISKAAGFTLVARDLPKVTVKVNITRRPYREVFQTLVNVYGADNVDYAALGNKLVVVAPTPVLSRTVEAVTGRPLAVPSAPAQVASTQAPVVSEAPAQPSAPAPLPTSVRVYNAKGATSDALAAAIAPFFPAAKVTSFGPALLINATDADHTAIQSLITSLEATMVSAAPATPAPAAAAAPVAPVVPVVKTVRRTYPLVGSVSDITTTLRSYFPELRLTVAETLKVIIADIPEPRVAEFETLLATVNKAAPEVAAPAAPEMQTASFPLVMPSQAMIDTLRTFVQGADVRYIPESGYVVIRGTAAQLVEATGLLNMINVTPSSQYSANSNPNALSQRVYRLSYAKATDILSKIKSFSTPSTTPTVNTPAVQTIAGTAQAMTTPVTGGKATDVPVGPTPSLVVDADDRTNSIIAMGTQQQLNDLQHTIDLLDVPVSQVRLHIRIEQVQSGKGNDLGVSWKAGIGGVTVAGGDSGLSVGYAPLGTLSPISLDVKLAALATQGASKTLMNTQFLTQDNQTTKFNAGGNILLPVSTPTTNTTTGTTTTNTDYKSYDYGLGVELQPRIGADGNIELSLNTQIGQKPADGPRNSVLFEKQTLNTKISIKAGETVVLGGLLTTEEHNTSSGVPLLSQIPIIGALFKKTSTSTSTSDLLFILSADVINPRNAAPAPSADVPRDPATGAQTTTIGAKK